MVSLDRCSGSCNTLDDPSGRICVQNKIENVNSNVVNMIARKNESKSLKNICHVIVNIDLIVENVSLIQSEIKC